LFNDGTAVFDILKERQNLYGAHGKNDAPRSACGGHGFPECLTVRALPSETQNKVQADAHTACESGFRMSRKHHWNRACQQYEEALPIPRVEDVFSA